MFRDAMLRAYLIGESVSDLFGDHVLKSAVPDN